MFVINSDNSMQLSIGDTAAFKVQVTGHTFSEDDRAVFALKSPVGNIVLMRYYEIEDGEFLVSFQNSDTDMLSAGTYTYDIRFVINPYYDDDGRIISGDQVITPALPTNFNLLTVVGEV